MNESIRSMQYNIESMKMERKPDFKIQFDHMSPLSSMMPQAFGIMGMISIPIAPWSKKMYQSGIRSMQYDIEAMQRRIKGMEEKVIPALQKTFDASFLTYQENKLSITELISNWEALNMMQIDLLDEKQKLYQMIVDYEKELYR